MATNLWRVTARQPACYVPITSLQSMPDNATILTAKYHRGYFSGVQYLWPIFSLALQKLQVLVRLQIDIRNSL